jgi:DNA-binding CsgD family transcriptional regulator
MRADPEGVAREGGWIYRLGIAGVPMAFCRYVNCSDPSAPPERAPDVAAPEGLEAYSFHVDSDDYVLFAFAVPEGGGGPASQGLTSSECAVLTLVLGGHSNAEVARVRGTSVRTIANQLAAIYQKLGVGSRRELGARQRSRAGVAK